MHFAEVKQTLTGFSNNLFVDNIIIKTMVAIFSTILSLIVTGNETLVVGVIFIYFMDMIFGVSRAIKMSQFSSRQFFKGIFKFAIYFVLLAIASLVDLCMHTGSIVKLVVFSFIIITDSISILENMHLLGFNVPVFLIKYLKVQKNKLEHKLLENNSDLEKEIDNLDK